MKNHTNSIVLLSCGTQNSFMLKHMNFDHCQFFLLPLSRTASGRKRTLKICLWHNFEMAEFLLYALFGYTKSYKLFLMNYL